MNRNFIISSALAGIALAACTANATPSNYTLYATLSPDEDGATAYIINYDNSEKIDSTIVDEGMATFSGFVEKPVLARLIVAGDRYGSFILEQGDITIVNGDATGGALNSKMNQFSQAASALVQRYNSLPNDSTSSLERSEIIDDYNNLIATTLKENIDNPIGYYLFLQRAYEMSLAELQNAIAENPSLGTYDRVKKLQSSLETKENTSVGKKFVDFEIKAEDGSVQRLSDYVGKGKYVLVDFWASWCGPCIRATATIKEILEEYGPKGLEVLGVAVWDDPDNTKKAIIEHDLPWPQIINAGNVPTDLYGISGIPCIILFSPDGTILSRDKQGEELKTAVANAFK